MGIAVWARRSKEHRGEIAFAGLWILLTLAPPLYIRAFLPFDIAHLRYLYLPCFGFLLLAVVALRSVFDRLRIANFGVSAAVLGCMLLMMACLFQQAYWSSDYALYKRSVAIAPHNPTAGTDFGNALVGRKQFDEAIAQYLKVVDEHPDFWLANYNLGLSLVRVHQPARALPYLERAIQKDPTDANEYYFRAVANLELGKKSLALADLDRAIALDPDNAGYRETANRVRGDANNR
jgi:tetratricopeptide (TPR) repeat protein